LVAIEEEEGHKCNQLVVLEEEEKEEYWWMIFWDLERFAPNQWVQHGQHLKMCCDFDHQ
jgi:hypothetical protein